MVLLITILIIGSFFWWLLISPLVLEIDSKLPIASLVWGSIGKATIWYEEEWWLAVKIFFYNKKFRLATIKKRRKNIKPKQVEIKKKNKMVMIKRVMKIIGTFRVEEWKIAIDTGDYCLNGNLYPFNFLPNCFNHIAINFVGDNFLYLRIKSRPWKMLYTLLG